ncbi:MAG TPA: cytochrome d ubiquinol oxidase subunit II, partial [Kouleothrix sp.]|nr:cytochrome d ubiquinol oxidase subunit II [Kouleothrix sp.]
MPSLELVVAAIMLAALIFYALLAGADFGGGVWDLLAGGPRAQQQRALIASAIGPIWEANHVWVILVIVLLFTAFPPAFVAIMTALHIPLTIMLIGIVLRGAAFTFRTYDSQADAVQRRWSRVFAIASVITPIMLGVCIGAIASGTITVEGGVVTSGFFAAWLAPFPWAVGGFALVLFAFLAAVYLTVEATDTALREDFRRRALGAAVAVGVLALLVFLLSGAGAPRIRAGI